MLTAIGIITWITLYIALFITIFWLLALLRQEENEHKKFDYDKVFSIIIPAYNEEKNILECLDSVYNLNYPNIQIVVVNDGSNDRTETIVLNYIKEKESNKNKEITFEGKHREILLINQENRGKAAAMNHGLEYVKGEFFASLDADSVVGRDAVGILLQHFADEKVAAVCPLMKVKRPKNIIQKAQWYEYLVNMFHRKLNAILDSLHVTPGPFSIYRTAVIKSLGGYDTSSITEDLEIAIRLQKHQYKIVQDLDAEVYTEVPSTLSGFYKQRNRWYKGALQNSIKYKEMLFNKKYGDFGIMKLPTIWISCMLAIAFLFIAGWEISKLLKIAAYSIYYSNFDIMLLLSKASLNLDILRLNFFDVTLTFIFIVIGVFIFFWAHMYSKEQVFKPLKQAKTFFGLVYYTVIYGILVSGVWPFVLFELLLGKIQKW